MPPNKQQLDADAVALAKAIRRSESQDNFNAKGGSGEWGAYQFMPDTWNAYAKEAGIDSPFGQATPEQQNEVAYRKIKQWKDQGYHPGQIASMWNAGPGKPDAYKGHKGVNQHGVQYDTEAYARKVYETYRVLKSEQQLASGGQQPQQVGTQPEKQSFLKDASDSIAESYGGLKEAVNKGSSGQIGHLSAGLQGTGAIASGINKLTGDALHHLPVVGEGIQKAEEYIGKGVQKVAETDLGQKAIGSYQDWAQEHPEAAGNLGAVGNIATALPVLKGLSMTKNALKGGVGRILKGKTDDVLETVAKDLGPKARAKAVMTRGTEKKGLLGEVKIKPDPREIKMADAVRQNVPRFNPGKPLTENIKEVRSVIKNMSDDLKNKVVTEGGNRIYPKQELISKLRNIDKPDLLVSDAVLDGAYNRLVTRLEAMLQKRPGKIDDLLDLRKEFDDIVARQYPDLYSSERLTPLRRAVSDVREEITDFTARNLPDGPGFRESLRTQHQLLKAMENMSQKAVKDSYRDVGSNMVSRFGQDHPLIKGAVNWVAPEGLLPHGVKGLLNIR